MPRPNATWDEISELNRFEHFATLYARELRDIGYDDAPEALAKLDGLVALASEHRARILRRAEMDADRMGTDPRDCVPPVEIVQRH